MIRFTHTTFVIERTLPARPKHAFRFFSEPALKRRWTSCHPDWKEIEARCDFRIGGEELSRLKSPDGKTHEFRSRYLDILEPGHIVYAFTMRTDGALISSSMATIEFKPASTATDTLMLYTEQAAFLGGEKEIAPRRAGTGYGFDRLVAEVERGLEVRS